jgi:Glycosyl transferase family 2
MDRDCVVAIPARDEEASIKSCLEALDAQEGARFSHIVVLVNNSTDATASAPRAVRLNPETQLHVIECMLPEGQANAGFARRLAMEEAAALAGHNHNGVLLTTDADGEVDADWLAANLAALRQGADAVAGWVELHPIDWGRIPIQLHEDDARECAYDALCDEIHARLDPDPADPFSRHTQHSGASIAVTAAAFARCGGVPAVPSAEDRALIGALRRVDARIRHAVGVHVTVSGHIEGRTPGGMADTIRRRLSGPDEFLDPRLEPAADCARRAAGRAGLRHTYEEADADTLSLATELGLSQDHLGRLLRQKYFGAAWEAVEVASPLLLRRQVGVADLPGQMAAAEAILAQLRPRPLSDRPTETDAPLP